MLKKLCSAPGCYKVVNDGVKYCERHKNIDREKYREYKHKRMQDADEARRQQFYNSKAWEGLRASREAAQYGVDIYELYTTGEIQNAERYHHIEEVAEDWDKRLDSNNVIGMSDKNHKRIHKEYERGYMARKKMQQTLYAMLERFRREFGDGGDIKSF